MLNPSFLRKLAERKFKLPDIFIFCFFLHFFSSRKFVESQFYMKIGWTKVEIPIFTIRNSYFYHTFWEVVSVGSATKNGKSGSVSIFSYIMQRGNQHQQHEKVSFFYHRKEGMTAGVKLIFEAQKLQRPKKRST